MIACPELACIRKANELRTDLEDHRAGKPLISINVALNQHVPSELIEGLIDVALERDHDKILFLCVAARLPDSIGMKIAELIEKSTTLNTCNITHNSFSYRVMWSIFAALIKNTSLQALSLSSNACCLTTPEAEDRIMLAFWLNPTLGGRITIARNDFFGWTDEHTKTEELRRRVATWGHPPLVLLLQYYDKPRLSTERRFWN